jgi:hypothetical protein
MGVPPAFEHHFSRADPAIVAKLKPALALRYLAVPLGPSRSGSRRIAAAMATPLDVTTVDDLSFALGARVEPMVAAEIVIARNIKRLYGAEVNLKPRLAGAGRPGAGELPPPAHQPSSPRSPAVLARTPSPKPASFERTSGMPRPTAHATPQPAAAVTPPPQARPKARVSAPVRLEDALHRLTLANDREQIADIVMGFMAGSFGCGMIFLARSGQARVWRGFAPGIQAAAIETIAFPISMPSCFQIAHDRRVPFRGPPPAEGSKLQRQIWKYLRCQEPSEVLVLPVLVKNRVLNLVYAHAEDLGRLAEAPVTDLQALCAAASSVYLRMIQRLKEETPAPHALAR